MFVQKMLTTKQLEVELFPWTHWDGWNSGAADGIQDAFRGLGLVHSLADYFQVGDVCSFALNSGCFMFGIPDLNLDELLRLESRLIIVTYSSWMGDVALLDLPLICGMLHVSNKDEYHRTHQKGDV